MLQIFEKVRISKKIIAHRAGDRESSKKQWIILYLCNKGPENLRAGNEYAINEINQALAKRDLRDKLLVKHQARTTTTTTQKMKI